MRYWSLFMIALALCYDACAQDNRKLDSLRRQLLLEKADTQKVHLYNQIAFLYRGAHAQDMYRYTDSALNLAQKVNFPLGIAESYFYRSIAFLNMGESKKSLAALDTAWSRLNESQKNTQLGVKVVMQFGRVYFRQKSLTESMNYYLKALKIAEKINYQSGVANCLTSMGNIYSDQRNYEEAIKLHNQAIQINEKLNDAFETYRCLSNLGYAYNHSGQAEKALPVYERGLVIAKEMKDPEAITDLLDEIGVVYTNLGQYKKAEGYFLQAIPMNTQIDNKIRIMQNRMNLAQCLLLQNRLGEAEAQARQAYQMNKEGNFNLLRVYETLLPILEKQGKQAEAYTYLKEYQIVKDSVLGLQKVRDLKAMRSDYELEKQQSEIELLKEQHTNQQLQTLIAVGSLGFVLLLVFLLYRNNRKERKAGVLLHQQKIAIEQAYENIKSLSEVGREMTSTLQVNTIVEVAYQYIKGLFPADEFAIGLYDEKSAQIIFKYYIRNGAKAHYPNVPIDHPNRISAYCVRKGDEILMRNIHEEHRQYIQDLSDYEQNDLMSAIVCIPLKVKQKTVGMLNLQSAQTGAYTEQDLPIIRTIGTYLANALVNSSLFEKLEEQKHEIETNNEELRQQQEELLAVNEALALQKEQVENQKQIIETTYLDLQHTTDRLNQSIKYAQRIQELVLPRRQALEQFFDDIFVLYLPKDVVSGDFYWFKQLSPTKAILCLADCTGHGVAGAFMSMIGSTLLHETISIKQVEDPQRILRNMSSGIRNLLRHNDSSNKDGMELAVCLIEKLEQHTLVTFAGTKTFLFYTDEKGELVMSKGSRFSIGEVNQEEQQTVENMRLEMPKGYTLYLSTDGYIDQGNPDRARFGSQRMKQTLTDIHKRPMAEQKLYLEQLLEQYQQSAERRDDISVIGIRL
jgi:serine phosphatase RsbU (regulator of sigma subunit)/tetratricopeptide (TPR) repeat protein